MSQTGLFFTALFGRFSLDRDTVFNLAAEFTPQEAQEAIMERIYEINPAAEKKKVIKFIAGK
jgi:hypothetical protein